MSSFVQIHVASVLVAVAMSLASWLSASASAAISPTRDAASLAAAIALAPETVTGASFVAIPPLGNPAGIADGLLGFPTSPPTFAILTTGDATLADRPNDDEESGAEDAGGHVRGDTDVDVSVLRIDLDVPAGVNCLSIDFQFLSDEFPEFVGSEFNDAFIAELDSSTWTTIGSAISAPNNFAFDPFNNVISVNATGMASISALDALGTTYDGATPLLTASAPITTGPHSLYLSIFDQGDADVDSAVFLDRLALGTTGPEGCRPGATVLSVTSTTMSPVVGPGGAAQYVISVNNPSGSAVTLASITDTLPSGFAYAAGSTSGATSADPMLAGDNLTWSGPFTLPAHGMVSLAFHAAASSMPGEYLNNASANASGIAVTPSGPTAKVTVLECGQDADCDDDNPCTADRCQFPDAGCAHDDVDDDLPCDGDAGICRAGVCVSRPTATLTATVTLTATPTPSETSSPTFTVTPTDTVTVTLTPTPTASESATPTPSESATPTPSESATPTPTPTALPAVTVAIDGICRQPGATGLEPCAEGTQVFASRCADRSCTVLEPLGETTTDAEGRFALTLDAARAAGTRVILSAAVSGSGALSATRAAADEADYRVLDYSPPSAAGIHNVPIDPATEAAVQLMQERGLQNYSDARAQAVVAAVELATAATDFSGLSTAEAVARATMIASAAAAVQTRLACAGDCDLQGGTAINELVLAVNIALGTRPVTACAAADTDANGRVSVSELIEAVNGAVNSCVIRPPSTAGRF